MATEQPGQGQPGAKAEQTTAPLPLSASTPAGTPLIGGRYALRGLLGEGATARVYRAHDTILDRIVAIKLLRAEYGSDPEFVARFYREARAIAALSHPNIIDIYDYGAHESTYFIAMQYLEGADLKTILRRHGRLTPEQAVAIIDGALRGLGAAHERGIIHRDVKPQNLLVREKDGLVKLTDFGIARALGEAQVTAAGLTFGTAHYMAPEQASGGAIGPATDLYAVGVVLFEALTGRLPFDGESAFQIGMQHLNAPPPLVTAFASAVPLPLTQVVARALAKDPAERFPSATAMRQALHAALPEGPQAATALAVGTIASPAQPTALLPTSPAPGPLRHATTATRRGDRYLLPALGALILALLIGIFALARNLVAPATGSTPTVTAPVVALAPAPSPTLPAPTATVPPAATLAPTPRPTVAPIVVPSTATALPPTATALPPTATAVPTALPTVPPTVPPPPPTVPPTVPPTIAPTPLPTVAPTVVPPTATAPPAPAPPGRGQGNGGAPQAAAFDTTQLQGAYRRDDGKLYGLPAAALYGAGTSYSQGTFAFRASNVPGGGLQLVLIGLDDERQEHCRLQIVLNGTTIFDDADTFPNVPPSDNGEGGKVRYWGRMMIVIPDGLVHDGDNTLVLRNRTPGPGLGVPYILINNIGIATGR